jgi:hypothetical protein
MSDERKKSGLALWANVIFWSFVVLMGAFLYSIGVSTT